MVLFFIFIALVGMVFAMSKSEDFSQAVFAVIGVLVVIFIIAAIVASCS